MAKADKAWVDTERVVSVRELDEQSRAYLPPAQHNLQCLTKVLASQEDVDEDWEQDDEEAEEDEDGEIGRAKRGRGWTRVRSCTQVTL